MQSMGASYVRSIVDVMDPRSFCAELLDRKVWRRNDAKTANWLVGQLVRVRWKELDSERVARGPWGGHWKSHVATVEL